MEWVRANAGPCLKTEISNLKKRHKNDETFFEKIRIKNQISYGKNGILLPKLFWPAVRKKCSSDQEKFEAEGRKFSKYLRSLEQFIQSERSEQLLVTECFFNLFLEVSKI